MAWNDTGDTMEEFLGHWMGMCYVNTSQELQQSVKGGEAHFSKGQMKRAGDPGHPATKDCHVVSPKDNLLTASGVKLSTKKKKSSSRIMPSPRSLISPPSPSSHEPVGFRGLQQLMFGQIGPRVDSKKRAFWILDFSFCHIRNVQDCLTVAPRSGMQARRRVDVLPPAPAPGDVPEELEEHATFISDILRSPKPPVGYRANCVKLNNNLLPSTMRIAEVLGVLVPDAELHLTSLDLSFNFITTLPSTWGGLPLQVLYLHSNSIADLSEVLKLQPLGGTLLQLTLHGNAVLQDVGYRPTVLSLLPRLRSLDFTAITSSDREDASHFACRPASQPRTHPKAIR
eukprot:GGOE01004868.1.p2 GENE.GGOE01004868.1~~GGOE01004868.1.p2  ORF type:complete len:341 (+),score=51.07 GGOE01004868.1:148-1170(+)